MEGDLFAPVDLASRLHASIVLPPEDRGSIDSVLDAFARLEEGRRHALDAIGSPEERRTVIDATRGSAALLSAAYGVRGVPFLTHTDAQGGLRVDAALHVLTPPLDLTAEERQDPETALERRVRDWSMSFFMREDGWTFRDSTVLVNLSNVLAGLYFLSLPEAGKRPHFDSLYAAHAAKVVGVGLAVDALVGDEPTQPVKVPRPTLLHGAMLGEIEKYARAASHDEKWFLRGLDRLAQRVAHLAEEHQGIGLFTAVSGSPPSELSSTRSSSRWRVPAATFDEVFSYAKAGFSVHGTEDRYRELVHSYREHVRDGGNRQISHLVRQVAKRVLLLNAPLCSTIQETDGAGDFPLPTYSALPLSVPPVEGGAEEALYAVFSSAYQFIEGYCEGGDWDLSAEYELVATPAHVLYHASLHDYPLPDDDAEMHFEIGTRSAVASVWATSAYLDFGDDQRLLSSRTHAEIVRASADVSIGAHAAHFRHLGFRTKRFEKRAGRIADVLLDLVEGGCRERRLADTVLGAPPAYFLSLQR